MTLCNLYSGGRATLYDVRHLKAFGIRTLPCRLPEAVNDPVCDGFAVLRAEFPALEPA